MTDEEVETSELHGKMRVSTEKCRFTSVEVPTNMMAPVALAERGLDSEHTVTKRKQVLIELKWNLQVAKSAVLSARPSALAKAERVHKCREKVKDAEE